MSEEAVRQTRSQKRALERDVLPLATELASSENDAKRPKLDQAETRPEDFQPDQIQAVPTPDLELAQDVQNRTSTGAEPEKEPDSEPSQLTLPMVLPLAHKPSNEEQGRIQKQPEPSSDNRTDPNVGRVKKEAQAESDMRSREPSSEPKVSSSLLAAGEVKATIKVEVQTGEQPVDMSTSRSSVKREKRPPSLDEDEDDDDVIILSDNDSPSPPMNGLSHLNEIDTELLMKSSPQERDRIIKQLKQELRLEEAKLVLLKKLRQSQIQKDALQKPSGLSGSAAPPPLIRGPLTGNKSSQQVVSGRSSGTVIPPPLVRGGQQLSSKHGSQVIMPPLVRGAQPISVSPQQIQALRQQQQQQLAASGGSGPPPLLLAPRNSLSGAQGQRGLLQSGLIRVGNNASLLVNISQASPTSQKGSSLTTQSGNSSVSVVNVNDSPASRQAAAKLALRKQLEKTLLEIPPPKPPAPEFNFHPSAANNEFIYLVGLEEVVQNLLSSIGRGKTGVSLSKPALTEPFSCTQCSTDFTCRWRHDKAKGGTILCEDCMSSNQKKAFKAEHTNRLKAAFVKALQQEQEIEQRILKQASSSPVSHTTTTTSSSSVSSASLKVEQLVSQQLKQAQAQARASSMQHHHQHSRGQNIIRHHSTSIKQSSQGQLSRGGVLSGGARAVPHSFSSSSQLQSAVAAAALVNRPGKHAHVSRPAAQNLKVSSGKTTTSSSSSSSSSSSIRGGSGGNAPATAWRKQNSNTTGVTMAYVNPSLSGHNKTSTTVDARQREYLLDMIPSRSISQTANTWK